MKSTGAMIDKKLFGSAVNIDISSTNHQSVMGWSSLFVGGAGAVALEMGNGETITFTGVIAGSVLPIHFNTIYKVGTTATNMVALN